MNLSALPEDEKLLLRRLEDLSGIAARGTPRFPFFLSERQALIAEAYVLQSRMENAMLFGGYGGAARKLCGFFPVYEPPGEDAFPIVPLTARFPASLELTHRDFLGALMSLGIKRESLGDIYVKTGACSFFALQSVSEHILRELKKVGNTGVSLETGIDEAALGEPEFTEIRGTVSSARLDSLVKLAIPLSREKSAALIKAGMVRKNHSEAYSISTGFSEGDTLSIRGYGRFIVDAIGAPTKKGRLPVTIRKFI